MEEIDLEHDESEEQVMARKLSDLDTQMREANLKIIFNAKSKEDLKLYCSVCSRQLIKDCGEYEIFETGDVEQFKTMVFVNAEPITDMTSKAYLSGQVKEMLVRSVNLNFRCDVSPLIKHNHNFQVFLEELKPELIKELALDKARFR